VPELPVVSGKEAIAAFEQLGWFYSRRRSSHCVLTKPGVAVNLSIPIHGTVDRGLLRSQIRKANITVEEFVAALKG
jgi:predicted RNA binding protein YcfA (HicA-like mRNA interferase family)